MKYSLIFVPSLLLAQSSLQTPARVTDSKTLPATLNTKVVEIRDQNGTGLKWDIRGDIGNPAAQTNRLLIRDNAGASVAELQRTFLGSITNQAIWDLSLLPRLDGTYSLGGPSNRWGDGHINRLRSSFIVPPLGDIELDGNLLLTAGKSIGKSAIRIPKIWVQDFDCAGTGCPGSSSGWTRDAGGFIAPTTATDDIRFRKWVIQDSLGTGLTWDLFGEIGNPASQSNRVFLRDNAGAKVVEFERTFLGTASNIGYLDMNWYPRTDGVRSLGGPSNRWGDGHINRLRSSFIVPPLGDIELDGNLLLTAGKSIGKSAIRIPKIWVQDFDCAGTGCPGGASVWSRDAGTGRLTPTTIADDVGMRKLLMLDTTGGSTLFFDVLVDVSGSAPGTRRMQFRDNAGSVMLELQRSNLGSTTNKAIFDMSIEPLTDGTRDIGSSTRWFNDARVTALYTARLNPKVSSGIELNASLQPGAHLTYDVGTISNRINQVWAGQGDFTGVRPDQDYTVSARTLGTVSQRWGTLYTNNIVMTGTCTGCPSGGPWTDGVGTTYLTDTAENLAIGLTGTTYKLDVNGTARVRNSLTLDSNLLCDSDGGCDIGDGAFLTNRPASGHFTTALFTYDGGGSSVVRTSLSGSGLIVRNSGGTITAQVGASGTFSSNGNSGQTVTVTVGASGGGSCTLIFSGGIKTGGTC